MSILFDVLPIFIRLVNSVSTSLDDVTGIEESDGVSIDSNVLKELLQVTPRCLVDIGQETSLELLISSISAINVHLVENLAPEVMLISQKIANLSLINRHPLGISPLSSIVIMLIPGLQGEVLLLADLRKVGSLVITASLINQIQANLLRYGLVSTLVLDQVKEDISLFLIQVGDHWHQFLELGFVRLVLLIGRLSCVVGILDGPFEVIRLGVDALQ